MANEEGSKGGAYLLGAAGLAGVIIGIYALTRKERGITLFGKVQDHDTSSPLSGVLVTANGATAQTDVDGNYELAVPAGDYLVTFAKAGYATGSANVTIPGEVPEELNISLEPLEPGICVIDDDCDEGYACVGGQCVPEGVPNQEVEDLSATYFKG